MSKPKTITVLGSTGSVGTSTLDLASRAVAHGSAEVQVIALTAGANVALLAEQALEWRPKIAVIADERLLSELRQRLKGSGVACAAGEAAVIEAAGLGCDWVMSAIMGSAGLAPTLAAVKTGAVIGLANKESLVCAGPALLEAAKAAGGVIIPVDSEHSAIFQVLDPTLIHRVAKVIITASGGPFRDWSRAAMGRATPEQAVAHPNFRMGAKISVDSATMMNKGLEMIEARYLFGVTPEQIEVLIHPEQIIHSMVEYRDGSTLAQLSNPDMRLPIGYALGWPTRSAIPFGALDWTSPTTLTFEPPDREVFRCIDLAYDAGISGGSAPAWLSAANEIAVEAFLAGRMTWSGIADVVAETLEGWRDEPVEEVESVLAADEEARVRARAVVSRRCRTIQAPRR